MHILTIEDDSMISELIERILTQSGMVVSTAATGMEGFNLAREFEYDLVLLDLKLTDMSGHEVLRRMRGSGIDTPTLILTGALDTESKLRGFALGADDYVVKPFRKQELMARIHAIVRRSQGHSQPTIEIGDLIINLDAKTVECDHVQIGLTHKEYQVLELLALRKGRTLAKEAFLDHLYGGFEEPSIKIVDVFICKLRKKLARATGDDGYIETIWGRGYVLRDPAQRTAA